MLELATRVLLAAGIAAGPAEPEAWVHAAIPLEDLLEGERWRESGAGVAPTSLAGRAAWLPRVVLEGAAEGYLDLPEEGIWGAGSRHAWILSLDEEQLARTVLVLRAPVGASVRGALMLPDRGWDRLERHSFTLEPLPEPAGPESSAARAEFERARGEHYARLAAHRLPGSPWFRQRGFRQRAGGTEQLAPEPEEDQRASRLVDTYELFSGGRALSENLKLDSGLELGADEGADEVALEDIWGIATTAIDWSVRLPTGEIALDPLAAAVPADQHALFVPAFSALVRLLDEVRASGAPLAALVESRSDDARTIARYERQLCVELDSLARLLGDVLVGSVAVTGSDPYFRTGTDVAVLFEAERPDLLLRFLEGRQKVRAMELGVEVEHLTLHGVGLTRVRTADRSVDSSLAEIGGAVVLTNSEAQLERLALVARGDVESLAAAPEYRFFRARYVLGDPEETALLVMTDDTIRRWCGPRWRIAASRRVRAAAALAAWQARELPELLTGAAEPRVLADALPVPRGPGGPGGGGAVLLEPEGVRSERYGTLSFLTPIAELDFDRVSATEHDAYELFRERYQGNWARYFDPIAVRLGLGEDAISLDLTVEPLIAGSDYRRWMAVTGDCALGSVRDFGEPRVLDFAFSIDHDSFLFRQLDGFARQALGEDAALDWVGDRARVWVEESDVWAEAARSEDAELFLRDHVSRLPVAYEVAVADPVRLQGFLDAARAFLESIAWEFEWQTIERGGASYLRIVESEQQGPDAFFAVLPDALVFSTHEDTIVAALDRRAADEPPAGWTDSLGESVSLVLERMVKPLLLARYGSDLAERQRLASWASLPILNEWRRLAPDRDPVDVHEALWSVRPTCPGGGAYVWNEPWQTFESTVFGHPGEPRGEARLPGLLERVTGARAGWTFEEEGLRARAILERD